jgi:hypothetical protein
VLRAYDHREFRSTGIAPQICIGIVAEYERLLVCSFESLVGTAIFVINDNENAIP